MFQLSLNRPKEPLVEQNSFRDQVYTRQPIPSFLESKARLPVPILPDHPQWVEMYWRAWEMAWSKLRQPKQSSGFVAVFLDMPTAESLSMWHSVFVTQFGLYARHIVDFMGTLDNFYASQHDDGFICGQLDSQQGCDSYYPFDPDSTGPNLLAWAEWRYYRVTGDDRRLPRVFWPLMALHRWFRANRTWPDGRYWATGYSSGMTNQPRVPDSQHHHRHWSWVDATMQAALNCQILARIAVLQKEEALATELNEEHARLSQLINETMWNDAAGFYQDVSPKGDFSPVKSIGAYWGLQDKDIIPEKRLPLLIEPLRESWGFKLPHRIPSQSADSEGYNAETGHDWRGAVWPPMNFMVLKGLRLTEQNSLAHEIALNHLRNVGEVYRHTDTFWENYAPESSAPGEPSAPDFVGCSGLTPISMLLEDVIGVGVDWPQRRVIWDRRLEESGYWGIRNYPLGPEGRLDLVGNQRQIVVITDLPFTLVIHDGDASLQSAISAGTTEIDLS
jgi:hypothetical protein